VADVVVVAAVLERPIAARRAAASAAPWRRAAISVSEFDGPGLDADVGRSALLAGALCEVALAAGGWALRPGVVPGCAPPPGAVPGCAPVDGGRALRPAAVAGWVPRLVVAGGAPRPGADTGWEPRPGADPGWEPRPGADAGWEAVAACPGSVGGADNEASRRAKPEDCAAASPAGLCSLGVSAVDVDGGPSVGLVPAGSAAADVGAASRRATEVAGETGAWPGVPCRDGSVEVDVDAIPPTGAAIG
jgi:hypothetical protein